ncbi:DNA cytosine methyltransferase [Pseudomonadota bacterium]
MIFPMLKNDIKYWDQLCESFEAACGIVGAKKISELPFDRKTLKKTIFNLAQNELRDWTPSKKPSGDAPIQVIDFFCGAGGMSLGFATVAKLHSSFQIIGGCDINKDAVSTFEQNFNAPGVIADVRAMARNKTDMQNYLSEISLNKSKPLVIIGCAPCQGFTSHRKKHWSKEDERNSLVAAFAKIAVQLKPECIVMENVPEMLSSKYWEEFEAARKILIKAGYTVKQAIYNCAGFGVPQERFRTLVIAMKKEFLLPEEVYDPSEFMTVRDAIGALSPLKAGVKNTKDPMHICAGHRKSTIDTIRAVPKNGGSRPKGVGPKCLDKINGFSDVYGRLYWDKPSITITHYARNPASGRFVHPVQDRGLSIREAATLQSFPVGFKFAGTFDSVFEQVGEAVPPRFACAVASSVLVEMGMKPPTDNELADGKSSVEAPVSNSYSSVIAGIKNKSKKQSRDYSCVDCFAGAGGLSLGLNKAGLNTIYSFDIDEKCIETQNMNYQHFNHKSEAKGITDMLNGELLRKIGKEKGDLFLLAGGPPCQGFSIQRIGEDKDQRNNLVLQYLSLIEEVQPRFFLIENVAGILGKRGKSIVNAIEKKAERLGYWLHVKTMDAQDYGVPQRRRRVVFVGERKDYKTQLFEFPKSLPSAKRKTVRDVIGYLPEPPEDGSVHPEVSHHRRDKLSAINRKRLAVLKQGEGRDQLPARLLSDCHKVSSNKIGHRNVYGRMRWDTAAPTITARFDSFTRGQFGHPDQLRTISLREGALLQSFPADFVFTGNKVDVARQIGNAVPPLMAKALGKQFIAADKKSRLL